MKNDNMLKLNARFLGLALMRFRNNYGDGVGALFYHIGYNIGLLEGENIKSTRNTDIFEKEFFAKKIVDILMERGFGRAIFTDINLLARCIRLRLYDSFEAGCYEKSDIPVCTFTRGYISGLIEGLTGFKIRSSREKTCMATGSPYCEYEFYL